MARKQNSFTEEGLLAESFELLSLKLNKISKIIFIFKVCGITNIFNLDGVYQEVTPNRREIFTTAEAEIGNLERLERR